MLQTLAAAVGGVCVESTYLSVPKHLDRLALHRGGARPIDERAKMHSIVFFLKKK